MKLDIDKMKDKTDEEGIKLRVKMSPISGSGIARVNSRVLDNEGYIEGKPHIIQKGEKKRVVRLVADDIMEKGKISLRRKDLQKIGAGEGEEIILLPSMKVGDRLQRGLDFFKRKED